MRQNLKKKKQRDGREGEGTRPKVTYFPRGLRREAGAGGGPPGQGKLDQRTTGVTVTGGAFRRCFWLLGSWRIVFSSSLRSYFNFMVAVLLFAGSRIFLFAPHFFLGRGIIVSKRSGVFLPSTLCVARGLFDSAVQRWSLFSLCLLRTAWGCVVAVLWGGFKRQQKLRREGSDDRV